MTPDVRAVRGALKLGFFISGLTVASLGARLASATISPHGADDARVYSIAEATGGSLSDAALKTLAGSDDPLILRFDPAAPKAGLADLLAGYERAPDLLLKGLDPTPQTAAELNASIPLSGAPNPAAKPFMLRADAENREHAVTCLTQAVYYEAGFEPLEGAQAVAQVVLNRVRHPIFPHSVCGVVYQGADLKTGCQFSFTCDGSLGKTPATAAWARAHAVAERALSGFVAKDVGEATHYHTRYVAPWWAPTVTKVAEVGAHIFYRWPGGLGLPAAFVGRYSGIERIGGTPADKLAATPVLTAAADAPVVTTAANGRVHTTLAVAAIDPELVLAGPTPRQRMQALAAQHALGAAFAPEKPAASADAPIATAAATATPATN